MACPYGSGVKPGVDPFQPVQFDAFATAELVDQVLDFQNNPLSEVAGRNLSEAVQSQLPDRPSLDTVYFSDAVSFCSGEPPTNFGSNLAPGVNEYLAALARFRWNELCTCLPAPPASIGDCATLNGRGQCIARYNIGYSAKITNARFVNGSPVCFASAPSTFNAGTFWGPVSVSPKVDRNTARVGISVTHHGTGTVRQNIRVTNEYLLTGGNTSFCSISGNRFEEVTNISIVRIDGLADNCCYVEPPPPPVFYDDTIFIDCPDCEDRDVVIVVPYCVMGEPGIPGIQGEKGDKGDKGDPGEQGERGIQGEKGDKGDDGERGAQGIQGAQGERGERGLPGEDGECPTLSVRSIRLTESEIPSVDIVNLDGCAYGFDFSFPDNSNVPFYNLLVRSIQITDSSTPSIDITRDDDSRVWYFDFDFPRVDISLGSIGYGEDVTPELTFNRLDNYSFNYDIRFPKDGMEDFNFEGRIDLCNVDGSQLAYGYSGQNFAGIQSAFTALGSAMSIINQSQCLQIQGETPLPACFETEEEKNAYVDAVAEVFLGILLDAIQLYLLGPVGLVTDVFLDIAIALIKTFIEENLGQFLDGTTAPEPLPYTGYGLQGISNRIDNLEALLLKIGNNTCASGSTTRVEVREFPVLLEPSEQYSFMENETQLTLMFGTQYPTTKGSNWYVSVPQPRENYNWAIDFENLTRKVTGNKAISRYSGRIYWNGTDMWSGGYFPDEESARDFLSAIAALSLAEPREVRISLKEKLTGESTASQTRDIRCVRAVVAAKDGNNVFVPSICYAPPAE